MRTFLIPSALAAALVVAGCGGGGGGGNSSPQAVDTPPSAPTELSCAADQSVTTPLGRLHNNAWNEQAAAGQSWRQCVVQRSTSSGTQYGWQWQWPGDTTTVLAYPSVVIGAKPWEAGPGNDARLPRAIASTNTLVLDYDLDTTATGAYNLAASLWLINTPAVGDPPDEAAIVGEVIVSTVTANTDWADGRPPLAQVVIDGRTWLVWHQPDWQDASGGSTQRWPLVGYTLVGGNTTKARLDLRQFLADAVSRGLISGSAYVADVELGNEIESGSGSTWINALSLTVN